MALPNTISKNIQGRLAIVIWASLKMVCIVEKSEIGAYSRNLDRRYMAHVLNQLTVDELTDMKHHSHVVAESVNSTKTLQRLLEIVISLPREDYDPPEVSCLSGAGTS